MRLGWSSPARSRASSKPAAAVHTPRGPCSTELGSDGLAGLIKLAQKDGHLNVVGEPPDWANEGPLRDKFLAEVRDQGDERGQGRQLRGGDAGDQEPQGPVRVEPRPLDIFSPSLAIQGANEGLMSPYKPVTWDTVRAGG